MQKVLMTTNGKKLLLDELEILTKKERPDVINAIEEARAHGDLKENAEYKFAKERQSFIEGRIMEINYAISNAEVIDPSKINVEHIVFGASISLSNLDSGEEIVYQLVGQDESDPTLGKIFIGAPIGKALIGKKVGDIVEIKIPKGEVSYEILNIEYK